MIEGLRKVAGASFEVRRPDIDFRFEYHRLLANFRDAPAPLLLDTGPPGAHSFAELILQRSLLAHAPPFLA